MIDDDDDDDADGWTVSVEIVEKISCKVGTDASMCWVKLCGVCQLIDASKSSGSSGQ